MSFRLLHPEHLGYITLLDAQMVLKYAKLARKMEKEQLRKKRWADKMKKRREGNYE